MKKNLLKSLLVAGLMAVSAGAWAQNVGDIVTVDGVEYQIKGANIITNGSFDDGVNGWYSGNWNAANVSNYSIMTEGGFDGGAYLQYSAGGAGSDTNIRNKWQVETGKTYLFRCYTSGKTPSSNNFQYSFLAIYDENANNQEGTKLYQLKWGADAEQVSDTWTENNFAFTATTDMVAFRSSWTEQTKLDGFFLGEAERYYSPEGYNTAIEAANAALNDTTYQRITGTELAALKDAIEKYTNVTPSQYAEATEALEAATKTFIAAKPAYDAYVYLQQWVENDLNLAYAKVEKPAVGEAATNAEDAKAKTAALYVALRPYYESHALAESVAGAVNMTDKIVNNNATDGNNGWTCEGKMNDPRNTESWTDSKGKNDYMYFDGGNWGGSNWTTTMKQAVKLPEGRYLLTAKGRSAENTTLSMSVGENTVSMPHVGASGNVFDRGWNDGSIEFETDGSDIEIVVTASAAPQYQWFSIGDFRLIQLEDKTPVGIAGVQTKARQSDAIYNLQGQQVKNAQKGLFIRDGKKYVVR